MSTDRPIMASGAGSGSDPVRVFDSSIIWNEIDRDNRIERFATISEVHAFMQCAPVGRQVVERSS